MRDGLRSPAAATSRMSLQSQQFFSRTMRLVVGLDILSFRQTYTKVRFIMSFGAQFADCSLLCVSDVAATAH